jgi:hypothetical protein
MPACEERKRKAIPIFRRNEFAELPGHILPRPIIVRWSNTYSIYIPIQSERYPLRETDVRSKRRAARSLSMFRDKTSATSTSASTSVIGPDGPACVPIDPDHVRAVSCAAESQPRVHALWCDTAKCSYLACFTNRRTWMHLF